MTTSTSADAARRVALPVVVRFAGAGAQIGVQIAAARLLGLWALAVYGTTLAWTRVAGNAVAQGYPAQVLRDTARMQHGTGLSLTMVGRRIVLGTAALAIVASLTLPLMVRSMPLGSTALVFCVVLAAGSYAAMRCGSERAKAAGGAVPSLLFEFVIPPLVVLIIVLGLSGAELSEVSALVVALSIPLGYLLAGIALKFDARRRFDLLTSDDLTFSSRLAAIGVMNPSVGAIPLLLAPAFVSLEEVAWLAAGLRLVAVPTLVFAGLAAFFAPRFSAAAAQSDTRLLRLLFKQSQTLAIIVYLPAAAFLLVFPQAILGLFDIHAEGAASLLRLLVLGQASNAVTGLSAEFLMMTDGEAQEFRATAFGAASSVVLVAVGGLLMGLTGVAIGFGVSLSLRFALSWIAVRQVLSKETSVLTKLVSSERSLA